MIKEITSTKNATYKYIKSLKTKKARTENRQYTVEGIKSVKDAISAGADIAFIAMSDKMSETFECDNIYAISDELFGGLCDTETPQGVIAVINMPDNQDKEYEKNLYLYCDRVTDPGNMGTIIRICDAVNCGLLLSPGNVDIYNPKTVRASMGSFFHTDLREGIAVAELEQMKKDGFKIISGSLGANTVDYRNADYDGKTVIVVGNEANGICDEILNLSDFCVKIPIWGDAESLNVGVASALLLYEARKNDE